MPITYTNRKGFTYFLTRGQTKTGKARYTFSRHPKGEPVEVLPDGYHVEESVNGIVSLVKTRPPLVRPEEIGRLEAALKQNPKGGNYRLAAKKDQIIVYEAVGGGAKEWSDVLESMGFQDTAGLQARLQSLVDRHTQYSPVMRFTLHDPETRTYSAERWCYLGRVEGWIGLGPAEEIERLAEKLIPTLGTDAFFELY